MTDSYIFPAYMVFRGQIGGAEQGYYNTVRGVCAHKRRVNFLCNSKEFLDDDFISEMEKNPFFELNICKYHKSRFLSEQAVCFNRSISGPVTFFPNYFTPLHIPKRFGKIVTLIFDLQYRHYPENFSRKKRLWQSTAHGWTLKRADTVIAISSSVRDDLLNYYGSKYENKIKVISLPIDWEGLIPADEHPLENKPYILSVANDYPHKNLSTLIKAFSSLLKRMPELNLVLIGQKRQELRGMAEGVKQKGISDLISSLNLDDKVQMTGYISSRREIASYYKHASVFAFPSLFEGFGLPPVEALGTGGPVLTTKCASIPEATMNMAQYVDSPSNPEEWADKLYEMLDNRSKYCLSGNNIETIRSRYSSLRVAEEMINIFEA